MTEELKDGKEVKNPDIEELKGKFKSLLGVDTESESENTVVDSLFELLKNSTKKEENKIDKDTKGMSIEEVSEYVKSQKQKEADKAKNKEKLDAEAVALKEKQVKFNELGNKAIEEFVEETGIDKDEMNVVIHYMMAKDGRKFSTYLEKYDVNEQADKIVEEYKHLFKRFRTMVKGENADKIIKEAKEQGNKDMAKALIKYTKHIKKTYASVSLSKANDKDKGDPKDNSGGDKNKEVDFLNTRGLY